MFITGDPVIDESIKEIASETVFNIETAKHFYLKTGDKEFCAELSRISQLGYNFEHLDYIADGYMKKKSDESWEELKKMFG